MGDNEEGSVREMKGLFIDEGKRGWWGFQKFIE